MGRPYRRDTGIIGFSDFNDKICFADNMEGGIQWAIDGDVGFSVAKETSQPFTGTYTLHLATKAAAPGSGDFVSVTRYPPMRPPGLYTFDTIFKYSQNENEIIINFRCVFHIGTVSYEFAIIYYRDPGEWYLYSGGAYPQISSLPSVLPSNRWHALQIVFDTSTMQYKSLCLDNIVVDLLGYPAQLGVASNVLSLEVRYYVTLSTGAANIGHLYIDNCSLIKFL